jgi:hypothetical protein
MTVQNHLTPTEAAAWFNFIWIKGSAKFIFNQGNYALEMKEEKSLLLYNPQKELPLN